MTTPSPASTTVLVTGGSGFVGSHLILQLLADGYVVRTTIRSLKKEQAVRKMLKDAGAETGDKLSFFEANLEKDDGWKEAITGCEYVHHVASPFPLEMPKHEDELIIPAREGALRVLRASRDAGVKRVIMTSSFAAVGYGHAARKEPFTEKDWTILDDPKIPVPPYQKSKTLAERAAWDFIQKEGGSLELATINATGIFGPALGTDISTSLEIVRKLMDGSVSVGAPRLQFGCCDVRDVGDVHIRAMQNPAAKGERFLVVNDGPCSSFLDIGNIIRKNRPDHAKKVPTRELPNWLIKFAAMLDPSLKQIIPELGKNMSISNEKAKKILGWTPRTTDDSITDTVDSIISHKLV